MGKWAQVIDCSRNWQLCVRLHGDSNQRNRRLNSMWTGTEAITITSNLNEIEFTMQFSVDLAGTNQSSILFNSLQFTIQFVVNLTKYQYEQANVQLNSSHTIVQCGPEQGSIQFNSQIKSMWRSKFNSIHFNSIHSSVYC